MPPVISVKGLTKSYGDLQAVRGIDLEIEPGEVFAFLGPNGAGKTTTVEILEGYRRRSGGQVSVLGEDPANGDRAWRGRMGVVLQECQPDRFLTVHETLSLFAGYYSSPRPVEETMVRVGLAEQRDQRVRKLSGGQQRRLDVGLALIGDPELIFLDEPTTGFDPTARRNAWELIAGLRDLGRTVFLTTHYMDEAQALADRVAIISGGQIVATGPPSELGGRADAATEITFQLPAGRTATDLPPGLGEVKAGSDGVSLSTKEPVAALNQLTGWALAQGVDLHGLTVARPSLEDVYLQLTQAEEDA
ncbi:MAG: type transport system ATP-binding protein [Thermoleophilaceae bacterium]|nr:type transport system ATP-binding protein [Thermoleophilaceae bacterium]